MAYQKALVGAPPLCAVHVAPEFDESQMLPLYATAASLVPLADEAMERQFPEVGAPPLCAVHVAPEFDESQMLPLYATAASFVPLADEAMESQDA